MLEVVKKAIADDSMFYKVFLFSCSGKKGSHPVVSAVVSMGWGG